MEYLITIGIVAAAVVLILICILSTWKKVPADKAAIVTGLGKAKVITGGGVIVIPVMQRIDYVTLENMSFDVNMQGTLTADAVPIEANGTVVVKIKNDETMIRSAVEQFNCGREAETRQHIVDTARDVCEGRLREIIADMTAEQLYKDRKTFSERVKEVAEEQLKELGLELKSFTIKGIGDQNGYFEALSKPQIAAVKRDAEIAQAEAIKESMIKTSEAKRAGEQARLEAEARVAEAKKDADIKKLNYERERQTTQAISDAAYSIQQNVTLKDITNTEMDANVLKEQRAKEVREAEIQILIAAEQKNIDLAKRKAERKEAELLEAEGPARCGSAEDRGDPARGGRGGGQAPRRGGAGGRDEARRRGAGRGEEDGRGGAGGAHQAGGRRTGGDHRKAGPRAGRGGQAAGPRGGRGA